MQTIFFIARRYLFSKKSHSIINSISIISMVGVMISTAALIIVLSVFNGFEELVLSMFNRFNAELLVEPVKGKTFKLDEFPTADIQSLNAIQYLEPALEENVLIRYRDKQNIVRMKGVEPDYTAMNRLDTAIVQGDFILQEGRLCYAVIGYGIAYNLQVLLSDFQNPLHFYVPDKNKKLSTNLQNNFKMARLFPSGFFSLRTDYDEKYVFVPLSFAQELLDLPESASHIEIGIQQGFDADEVKKELIVLLGPNFSIKTRAEQQTFLLKMMRTERWAIFLILSFILLIAAFNVIGSLSMLIIDKTKDIFTLHALGANRSFILGVFAWEGLFISMVGGLIGLFIGGTIAGLQQNYGFISLGGGGNFVVDAYPVFIKGLDFLLVMTIVLATSIFSVIYPLVQLSRKIKVTQSNPKAVKNAFQT